MQKVLVVGNGAREQAIAEALACSEGDPRLYIVDHYKIEFFQEWLSAPPYRATPTPG